MEKIECAVVNDLLPLYCDGVVSKRTSEIVVEHLETCESCKAELEKIKEPIPEQDETITTREKFRRFMKKHRIKRAILIGLLIAALIAFSLFAFNIPVVDVPYEHFGEVRAYRYVDEEGHKRFCVIYSSPEYGFTSTLKHADLKHPKWPVNQFTTEGVQSDGGVLKAYERTPLIRGFKKDVVHETIWTFEAENFYGDYSKLIFGGETIWTIEENADDPVPEYVYYYDKLEKACWRYNRGYTWIMDFEQNIIGGMSDGGEPQYWNFEGGEYQNFVF